MSTLYLAADFNTWWSALSGVHQLFLLIGVSSGIVAAFLTLGGVLGFGHDSPELNVDHGDSSGDAEGFSLRSITGFFLGFGWTGAAMLEAGMSIALASIGAVVVGAIMMLVIQLLMKSMRRLRSDGTMNLNKAVGADAQVYVTIPPAGATGGQVIVYFGNRQETLPAIQAGADPLAAGTRVKVTALTGRTLTVQKS